MYGLRPNEINLHTYKKVNVIMGSAKRTFMRRRAGSKGE